MRLAASVIVGALLTGCEFTRDPVAIEASETQYGVFAMLRAGVDSTTVLVARFLPSPSPNGLGWEGVSGANVRLVAGADTIALTELPFTAASCAVAIGGPAASPAGCYQGSIPGGIQSGSTYGLVVDIPDFGRIIGSTTVPAPPVIVSPVEGAVLPVDFVDNNWPSVLLRIDAPAGTERIEVTLAPNEPGRTCEAHFLEGTGGVQGLVVLDEQDADGIVVRYRANCQAGAMREPVGELDALIRAVTVDPVYARFAETVLDEFPSGLLQQHTRAGIDRGVGFFAGSAAADRRVVLTGNGS